MKKSLDGVEINLGDILGYKEKINFSYITTENLKTITIIPKQVNGKYPKDIEIYTNGGNKIWEYNGELTQPTEVLVVANYLKSGYNTIQVKYKGEKTGGLIFNAEYNNYNYFSFWYNGDEYSNDGQNWYKHGLIITLPQYKHP